MEMNNQAEILRRCSQRRPNVVLAWDDTAKKIVAPPTQVGMSWNHAFSSLGRTSTGVVDNFDVPKEVFELSSLDDVLTMEAWESCLSESEKELLSIYLPQGVDQHNAVRALLNGENIHFGNPRQTWGASVCAGAMHPDNLVKRETAVRKSRKVQRKHLRSYHTELIRKLQGMKDIWSQCRNNAEVLPRIHRWLKSSRRKSTSPTRNGFIPTKRASEPCKVKTKVGGSGEMVEGHKTTRKANHTEIHNRHSAKRQKTNLSGDKLVDKEVHQSVFESDFFKKYVKVSVGALTKDRLSDITVAVKVTRKQFEHLKCRYQAGEEVDFDSLDSEVDHGSTGLTQRKKNEEDSKEVEELKRYWREQVVKSLPEAHTKFLERKSRVLELADAIARSCLEERAYVMQQKEEPCSADRLAQESDEDRIPTDTAGSGAEDETSSQNWLGKHLVAGGVSGDAEEEYNMQSPQEEATDMDSGGEEEDVHSRDQEESRHLDVRPISEEKPSSNECSPVSRVEVDLRSQDVEIDFTRESPIKVARPEESFESEGSAMPSSRLDDFEKQRHCDSLPGYQSEQPAVGESLLIPGHHTFSAGAAEANFVLPEKQELQLLPHTRHMEVPNLHHIGSVPESVQEPAQLFTEHTQMSHQFENPISSLINFSKRQHQLNAPPPPLPQHPYPSFSLPSSAPLPMAVPVVELAPMWPNTVHRPSAASTLPQFGGGQNGSWPVPDVTSPGGGWGLSEAIQSASRRAQLQVPPPAPVGPRWDVPSQSVYPTDQPVRKPERLFDQQQFYTDWSSRGEFPATPTHSESATPYRAPSWYPTGPFDNFGNPLSANPVQQHLPLQRHPLWPSESAPPKPVPQLWGNMNWRPS